MMGLVQLPDFLGYLTQFGQNPYLYLPVFFVYSLLAVAALPLPVEAGLFNQHINPVLLIVVLALGKGAGGFVAFYVGTGIGALLRGKSKNKGTIHRIIQGLEKFVKKTGLFGLLIIVSIPLMVDTVPVYLYSLLHPEKEDDKLKSSVKFGGVNFFGGLIRASIVILLASFIGIKLVG